MKKLMMIDDDPESLNFYAQKGVQTLIPGKVKKSALAASDPLLFEKLPDLLK